VNPSAFARSQGRTAGMTEKAAAQMIAAADGDAGVKDWKGLGLVIWGLQQAGNTRNTP